MKPIRLVPSFTKTSLTSAVLMGSIVLCNQAYAEQTVTTVDSVPVGNTITFADLQSTTNEQSNVQRNNVSSDNLFLASLPKAIEVVEIEPNNKDQFLVIDEKVDVIQAKQKSSAVKTKTKRKASVAKKSTKKLTKKSAKQQSKKVVKQKLKSQKIVQKSSASASIQVSANRASSGYTIGGQAVAVRSSDRTNDDVIKNLQKKSTKGLKTLTLSNYSKQINASVWKPNMRKNSAMTVKLQALLDWNHASPGPIDGGWGMNSKKALRNFQAMKGLKKTGRMNQATWNALTKNIPKSQPVLIDHKIRDEDVKYAYTKIPKTYPEKFKLKALNYSNIYEKLAEEYHMNVRYLRKLNKGKKFVKGQTITVLNPGKKLKSPITKVIANKKNKTLYAYNGKRLVATYPTTVGSSSTPSPHGTFKIANRVKKPHYKATVGKEGEPQKKYLLKPGPNSPVGIVWMGLTKPSFGIHGSPVPEGISRQGSQGCVRLTNWDALEVHANIKHGAKVVLD